MTESSNEPNKQCRVSLYYRHRDGPDVLIQTIDVEEGKKLVKNWYFDLAMRLRHGGRENVSYISLEERQEDGTWKAILSAVDPLYPL